MNVRQFSAPAVIVFATSLLVASAAWAANDPETNKKILKDAIQGAITGAVASSATADESAGTSTVTITDTTPDVAPGDKNAPSGKRPPGWDKGKKTGWDGGDEPPGLAKKNKGKFWSKNKEKGRPPGWEKGEKTGWDGASEPPGHTNKSK